MAEGKKTKLIANALGANKNWSEQWAKPEPKSDYDVIIVGAGGHGLAAAYYLAKEHNITNVAVLEKGCLQTANWLTKSLDQRAHTILKVATEIVRVQDGFLAHGLAHLKPMTLKMVADAIEMHESTVSRVTSNKYISTPRGLFELKFFFTAALSSTTGGAEHSAEAVRHHIKNLIEGEEVKAILSDDIIAETLKRKMGVDIARRTIAKYREAMNIPSSIIRRRQKKMATLSSRPNA